MPETPEGRQYTSPAALCPSRRLASSYSCLDPYSCPPAAKAFEQQQQARQSQADLSNLARSHEAWAKAMEQQGLLQNPAWGLGAPGIWGPEEGDGQGTPSVTCSSRLSEDEEGDGAWG